MDREVPKMRFQVSVGGGSMSVFKVINWTVKVLDLSIEGGVSSGIGTAF